MEGLNTAIDRFDYEQLNNEIKRTMKRSARDIVQIGYMLRRMMDEKLWQSEYSCLDDYLSSELGIDYTMATRMVRINKKYSIGGNSMYISEAYANYSQGLLIEMLNMPKELEEKVNPDMTVKQVRQIKKEAKKKEKLVPAPEQKETVIDAEYREVDPEPAEEKVATSQYDTESSAQNDELKRLRKLLDNKNKELKEWMDVAKVEDVPEDVIYEKKTVVGALASILYELEDMREKEGPDEVIEPENTEQTELPVLKNADQRKEWLASYKAWGLWYRDENIDVNYYKYDFPDGSRLVVAEYPKRHSYWSCDYRDETTYHLLEKNKSFGKGKHYDESFRHSTTSETYLVEFLKNLQKRK